MSQTESDADTLKRHANETKDLARVMMAAALALEDGVIDNGDVWLLIDRQDKEGSLAVVQSDEYPGDQYFDRAENELRD